MITVEGELDAANADQLTGYVQQCVRSCRWLTLDLRHLEFIGTAGFPLFTESTWSARRQTSGGRWCRAGLCRGYSRFAIPTARCRSWSR
ncbi:putative anti-sigma-factor antagonist [Mycobacterium kansasii]|uniref:Putative anti-sigma-factor antagonist n=1 Tax=Mycobacterium kansasii TaxID=1768 RepID=A0A1V3WLT4_MYCKA|nr:putative anti-sigma-factor antagonist [Mycobacterium kansasii]